MKKYLVIFIACIFLIIGGYFYAGYPSKKESQNGEEKHAMQQISENKTEEPQIILEEKEAKQGQEFPKENVVQKIRQNVPFVVQAPFGNWKDPIFQNGCEEAAMIMASEWTKGILEIPAKKAQEEIKKLTAFEDKTFGYNTDTDIYDMQKIFQNYFGYQNVKIQKNIKLEDIKNEIQKGSVVLVPAFGRALKNPNYTAPGPVAHMLVIIGYDPDTKKFITNDSGTKNGKGYLYPEDVLFEAIWGYNSGSKAPQPPAEIRKKEMLVIIKSQ